MNLEKTAAIYSIKDSQFAMQIKALANRLRECSDTYNNIIVQNTNIDNEFENHYKSMLDAYQQLEKCTDTLRKENINNANK